MVVSRLGRGPAWSLLALLLIGGCRQWFIDDADREVAGLIEQRQRAALGAVSNADVGPESGRLANRSKMYRFVPSPVDAAVPEPFRKATQRSSGDAATGAAPAVGEAPEAEPGADMPRTDQPQERRPITLSDALSYAMRHARDFQSEKEDLYLTALDLTLERYLWTPRFVESVLGIDYANFGQVRDFDRAMTAVSTFAVEQRLPYGGQITARVINTLMRDLGVNITSGESGQFSIDATFPMLRGAGPVAYEGRYRAERELVYAVRRFERFRRTFVVDIASAFFDLLSAKTQVGSAAAQAKSLAEDYRRAKALANAGRTLQVEADRARVALLDAQNRVVTAQERYDTALDLFKIRIGMPTKAAIDVAEEPVDLSDPQVDVRTATETALHYRLDLLNSADAIDDARRAVEIARNDLLPRFDFTGSVTMNTDPTRPNSVSYNTERTTWRAGLDFEVPLDRKAERNAYRRALIILRRAQRDHDELADRVRQEVRRAARRLEQARFSMEIQVEQMRINEFRAKQARANYEMGKLASNRDVVEAEDDLSAARDDFANAQSQFRRAVLEFLRDTGTLRIGDDGKWLRQEDVAGEPAAAGDEPAAAGEARSNGKPGTAGPGS